MRGSGSLSSERFRQQFAPQTRVDFELTANLRHGESLVVASDRPAEPGHSSPLDNGVELVTTPELYPLWFNPHPVMIHTGTELRFRYAIFGGGKFKRWEQGNTVHSVSVEGHELLIQDTLDKDYGTPVPQTVQPDGFPLIPRLHTGEAFVSDQIIPSSPSPPSVATGLEVETKSAVPSAQVIRHQNTKSAGRIPHPHIKNMGSPPRQGPVKRRRSFDDSLQETTISKSDSVLIVCYKLPVIVTKREDGTWNVQWDRDQLLCPTHRTQDSGQSYASDGMRVVWVGTVPCNTVITPDEEDAVSEALQPFRCWPVFLSPDLAKGYEKYCLGTLWPIFHNVIDVYGELPTRWWNPTEQDTAWSTYATANKVFSDAVVEAYHEGDMIWVHDLHLLILPSFLSRRLRRANIGLFLHTPFPSSELFRTLSVRDALLSGMLSADHIGFHLYEYARHFLTSCRRIMGLTYGPQQGGFLGVDYGGRLVNITISHAGIEPSLLDSILETDSYNTRVTQLIEEYKGKVVLCGLDSLGRLSGIQLKLLALREFLKKYPEQARILRLVQVCVADSGEYVSRQKSYQQTLLEVRLLRDQINQDFPTGGGPDDPVIHYKEVPSLSFEERMAYMGMADAFLLTHVRGGIQLNPFEYVYTQEFVSKNLQRQPGTLIMSEFVGCSRVLHGAWSVNPWRKEEVVEAIEQIFSQSEDLRKDRHQRTLQYILGNTTTRWAERVLVDLKRSHKKLDDVDYLSMGFGFGFRMLGMHHGFQALDVDKVLRQYRKSSRRCILLDFGGTLVAEEPQNRYTKYLQERQEAVEELRPSTLNLLQKLCDDPRNTVFILSGKERSDLKKAFTKVRSLGLAAEHGYFYHWPRSEDRGHDLEVRLFAEELDLVDSDANYWETVVERTNDDSWKEITHSIMDIYTQRTDGTYIEKKGSALVWQYSDADPEFGMLQAKELQDQLVQVLEHFNVDILIGKGYLEVRPEGVHKGLMVDRILSTVESTTSQYVDFVLCIGDDASDEPMFVELEERTRLKNCYTVTVGKKPSAAQYYVNDVESVIELLTSLTKISTSANRIFSMNDMSRFTATLNQQHAPTGGLPQSASMSVLPLHQGAHTFPRTVSSQTLTEYFHTLQEEDDEGGIFF